ncbi:MAG: hypothetical protein ACYCUM_01865 [Solirubrobacteraceae bacterium]
MSPRSNMLGALATLATLATLALAAPSPAVAAPAPHWVVSIQAAPSSIRAGSAGDYYEIIAVNDGAAATSGPVTLTDTLPGDTVATEYKAYFEGERPQLGRLVDPLSCAAAAHEVTCSTTASVPAGGFLLAKIDLDVSAYATGSLQDAVSLSGGGAVAAHASLATPVSAAPVVYGAATQSAISGESGEAATQAGSRPFAFTSLLSFAIGSVNTSEQCFKTSGCGEVLANARDVEVALPAGLVGNPRAVPRCSQADFQRQSDEGCPANTQVGDALLIFGGSTAPQYAPIYDVAPPPGEPAELGFTVGALAHVPVFFHVRTEGDYGVTADIAELSEFDPITAAALTLWGVPAAAAHDRLRRGAECEAAGEGCAGASTQAPFLTLPTSCAPAGLTLGIGSDSWQQPLPAPLPTPQTQTLAGTTGCASLPFAPSLSAGPESAQAGAPTGYHVALEVPQHEAAAEDASAQVRDALLTLPAGAVISASAGKGLAACEAASFAPRSRSRAGCPPQSRIGSVEIFTPLLREPLTGGVYLGAPECDPCDPQQAQAGRLVKLYLEASGSGIVVKLVGQTSIAQADGRLTTTFDEAPQLPFGKVLVTIEGGPDAPLANGVACGPQSTSALLAPWSGSPPVTAGSQSALAGCSPPAFAPTFQAGATGTTRGGASSGFSLAITRPPGQQPLGRISIQTPPGLLASIAGVPRCGEAAAEQGACPAASQIGSASALLGPGTQPLAIHDGRVYLTGPYEGAPFGLSIVIPADIGPFHLSGQDGEGGPGHGNVVVRASVALDPRTTALTILTKVLPSALDGIPLEVDELVVALDRPGFVFNPTSCGPMRVAATISDASGTGVARSYPFQASGCAQLPFAPKLTVTTHAGHTRKLGAYLAVEVTTRAGEADLRRIHVTLPGRLPARLSTLKLACTEAQFAANPARCPPGSIVGTARAQTAMLATPLSGPAIFVSHGGAEFPNLDLVLQGEGVTIVLEGDTFINARKITSSTFHAIPDVPVRSFAVTLPEGPRSALAGNGSLCRKPLRMPTTIKAQNGAVVEEDVTVSVRGCRPQIEVLSQRVRGARAKLEVKVPGPGRLLLGGAGIARVHRRVLRAKVVTLTARLASRYRRALARHPGRRLRVAVWLRLQRARARTLFRRATVLMR